MSKIIKASQKVPREIAAYERDDLGVEVAEPAPDESGTWEEPDPVAQAEAEAERRLQELYSEGLRRGIEAGKAEFEQATAAAVGALQQAAAAMVQAREDFLNSLEPQVLELVQAMVLRILDREARQDPQVVVNTVRRALAHFADRERMNVCLNPADLEAIRAHGIDPFAGIDGLGEIELAADASVDPGGCVVETDSVRIDARLDRQLEQILETLSE